jgi:DNA-binding transcriptional LysR family regulator
MALAELERQMGARLFDRISRRLVLNENGRSLYPKAAELIDRARELESTLTVGTVANLRIGASSSIGNYILPALIGDFLIAYPDSSMSLSVGNTHEIIDKIRQFEIDVGFVEGPCLDADIVTRHWRDDNLVICAGADHPLAQKKHLTPEDLLQARWLMRETGSGTREVVDSLLSEQLGALRQGIVFGGTEAIKRAVETGLGISCLSRVAIENAVQRGTIICLPTPFLRLKRALNILLHRQKYSTRGIENFIALCEKN